MLKLEVEKKLATYLSVGTVIVTVFLLASTSTDPVNVTKLFALGGVAVAVFGISVVFGGKILLSNFKPILITISIFYLLMIFVSVASKAPFSQNYFGTFGRNNGLLTYALLSAVMLSTLLLTKIESFEKMIYALFVAGSINVVYCAWVLAFGDFIPWSNPYKNILGLFGNPDFISAFLGMFIAGSLAFIATTTTSLKFRLVLSFASIIALFEIVKSHAIQGLVVTAGGIAIVGFYRVRATIKTQVVSYGYALLVMLLGITAVLGTLQKGPLSFVYKRSVSFRGSYWRTGIEMGNSHPFTGVGLDTYGDWYKRARPPIALIDTPGIATTSNVAHNVVIDFFASGGFPLLLCYLAILVFGLIAIIRVTARNTRYDRIFVGLTSVWLCYEVQSIISINQIGLAIWGWVFTGLLIAYEHSTRSEKLEPETLKTKSRWTRGSANANVISPQFVAGIGMVVGLLIALPPLSADAKWYSATKSRDVAQIESALAPGVFNPADSSRYAQAVNLFQSSNLLDLAHKYALIAVEFNPDYSESWKQLYALPQASPAEKSLALSNMKRLDPKNPDVTAN